MNDINLNMDQNGMWEDLNDWLHQGDVSVVFTKKDGTERTMYCTLVEEAYADYEFKAKGLGLNDQIVTVWDLENDGWRTISKGSVLSLEYFER